MPSPTSFQPALQHTLQHALTYLDSLDAGSVSATATLGDLRKRLGRPLAEAGAEPVQVVDDLVADVRGGLLGSAGGRFFGWVIGGAMPAALAADWLTSTWDQNAAVYACSPAAAVIEEVCGAWLKELLGIPASASFALVTGCQMAHFTCLAAARNRLLATRGWDVERDGLMGAPRIHILSHSQRHGSIERALRFLGLGHGCVTDLEADELGRLRPEALEQALAALDGAPAIVLLSAGDINMGAYDRFEEVIPIAHGHGAWVHVDGAFGLWAQASAAHRAKLRGAEGADSWATDGHKWLNVPYDSGYAFVADPVPHKAAMGLRASYMTHADDVRDQFDWNPEWSRRARGVASYAAIRELGRQGVADLVDRCCIHAKDLAAGIGAIPGANVMWAPTLNQGLIRFPDPAPGATEADHDAHTDRVIAAIVATGMAFFGGTTWRGLRCMRISVCGWRTSTADVQTAVQAVRQVLEAQHGQ